MLTVATLLYSYLWAILAFLTICLVAASVKCAEGLFWHLRRSFPQVEYWFTDLFRRGYAASYMDLKDRDTGRFIRVRKYIREGIREQEDYGLELLVPRLEWSRPFLTGLRAHCEESGLSHRIDTDEENSRQVRFSVFDCGQDVGRTFDLALTIWTDFYSLPKDTRVDPFVSSLWPLDEPIESSSHPRYPDDEDAIKLANTRINQELQLIGFGPGRVFQGSVLVFANLFAFFGLPAATLLSMGDAPDWSMELGDLTLEGTTVSLTFFIFFLSMLAVSWRFYKTSARIKRFGLPRHLGVTEKILWNAVRIIEVTLPIAVILIWAGV